MSLSRFDIGSQGDLLLVTRERHRFHLEECLQCLNAFLGELLLPSSRSILVLAG